jgi:ribosomal protein S18 acetylase RimI-like enzyme
MSGYMRVARLASMADPAPFTARVATDGDAPAVAGLYQDREGVSADDAHLWVERVLAKRSMLAVAEVADAVVGYGLAVWLEPDDAPAGFYLGGVVVSPKFRRMGIGRALTRVRIEWVKEQAETMFYFANARNQATLDLHAGFGFVEVRRADTFAGVSFDGGEGILFEARP